MCVQVPTEARREHQIELVFQDSYELPDGVLGTELQFSGRAGNGLTCRAILPRNFIQSNQKYFSFFDLNNSTKNYNNHLGKNSSGLIFFTT